MIGPLVCLKLLKKGVSVNGEFKWEMRCFAEDMVVLVQGFIRTEKIASR